MGSQVIQIHKHPCFNNIMDSMVNNDLLKFMVIGHWSGSCIFLLRLNILCGDHLEMLANSWKTHFERYYLSYTMLVLLQVFFFSFFLIACEKEKEIWQAAGLWILIHLNINSDESYQGILFNLLHNLQPQEKNKLAVILWSIWRNRNQKVWDNVDSTLQPLLLLFLFKTDCKLMNTNQM